MRTPTSSTRQIALRQAGPRPNEVAVEAVAEVGVAGAAGDTTDKTRPELLAIRAVNRGTYRQIANHTSFAIIVTNLGICRPSVGLELRT